MKEIDCKWGCGNKTTMLGTRSCDPCWEANKYARFPNTRAAVEAGLRGESEPSAPTQSERSALHAAFVEKYPDLAALDNPSSRTSFRKFEAGWVAHMLHTKSAQSEPEASGNAEMPPERSEVFLNWWHDYGRYIGIEEVVERAYEAGCATTTTPAAQEAERGRRLENLIDDYLSDYNFEGDNGCGYCPSDDDKFVMKDAIMGLIADEEFGALFAQTQPQAKGE